MFADGHVHSVGLSFSCSDAIVGWNHLFLAIFSVTFALAVTMKTTITVHCFATFVFDAAFDRSFCLSVT